MSYKSNAKAVKAALSRGAVKGVTDASLFVLADSVQRAPVDTGDLRGSGSTDIRESPHEVEGVIGYNVPYAVEVHENMAMVHPRGGEAKFLENAFTQNRERVEQHIQDAIREGLK